MAEGRPDGAPTVAAVMVNWNGGPLAVRSARSVAAQSVRPALWVVDNASTDGSMDAIVAACPDAHVIRNDVNRGFAAANNQALRELGDVDWVLLVNNDVILPDADGIARVIAALESKPGCAGAVGRYEYPEGDFQRFYNRLPTLHDMVVAWGVGRYVRPLRESRRAHRYAMRDERFDSPMDIEQPAFACVLMRGAAMREVGLLDERFPIFFNDVDYCWRWREAGHRWRYFPDWQVVHYQGRSTKRLGPVLAAELSGSALRFARKHLPAPSRWVASTAILADALWRTVRHREPARRLPALWRGDLFFRAA